MMRIKIIAILLTFVLSVQLGSVVISVQGSEDPELQIDNDTEFMPWVRDSDRNGIDDLLDVRRQDDPRGRAHIYVDYDHYPTVEDKARLASYLDISYEPKYINTLCALNVPLDQIPEIVKLDGVIMVEEQLLLRTQLDNSTRAIKARESSIYKDENEWGIYGYDGSGITVAVLDTGVDDSHPTFADRYLGGYDATSGVETNPGDGDGHGTHVAGIVLGQGGGDEDPENNYKGVAPGAKLIDVKVSHSTAGLGQDFIRGVDWCIEQEDDNREWDVEQSSYNGIDILSVSLGDNSNDDGNSATAQAVNSAVEHGIVVVCAVGNDDENSINAPASADRAISVGAIDYKGTVNRDDDEIWSGSNTGPRADDGDDDHMDELKPDVVAPGVDIVSSSNNYEVSNHYRSMTGTSQATPHVTGTVALMLHSKPYLKVDTEVKNVKLIFRRTPEKRGHASASEVDPDWNSTYGWGLVDAYKAVRYATTDPKVSVTRLDFDDDEPNEGDSMRIDIRVGETNGVDVEGGVVRVYKDSIGSENLLLEKDLEGLRGGAPPKLFPINYEAVGGENKIIVTVKEIDGSDDVQDEKTITANYKPIAEIFTDNSNKAEYGIEPGQTVHFHGNASHDEEHHDLLYRFSMGDGTTFDYSTTSWVEHTFENGRYRVRLNVKDEYGAVSDPDDVYITANLDPTAEAGEDIVAGRGDPVTFDGTAFNDDDHDDPNDAIVLYEWDFDDDEVYEFEDDESGYATHTYDELGKYKAWLRVTDRWGAQSEDSVNVKIVEGKPPRADAGEDQTAVVDETVYFSGTASDEDGTIEKYEWDFDDGSGWRLYENGEASHIYEIYGDFTARFRITDNDDNEDIDTRNVRIHRKPEARIESPEDENNYISDEEITFDASGSSDPDGTALSYEWTSNLQGDIGNSRAFSRTLEYGRHKITLEVTDADGAKDSAMVTIAVKDASDTPPTVSITTPGNNSWHQVSDKVLFKASGSDPDGDPLKYSWEIGEKSFTGSTISISLAAGSHEVKVFADDGRGGIGQDTIIVNMNKQPVAAIKGLKIQYEEGETIPFDASESYDPDGHEITNYIWHSDIDGVIYENASSKINKQLSLGDHNITLTVRDIHGGQGSVSTFVIIKDAIDYSIKLFPTKISSTATYVDPAIFTIKAKNDKGSAQRVQLIAENIPLDWTVTFWWENALIPGNMWRLNGKNVDNGEDTFDVKVEVPRDAQLGQSVNNIRIIGDMGDGVKHSIDLHVVVDVYRSIAVSINAESPFIDEAGDSIELELTLTNKGNAKDTFELGTNAPGGWKVSFDQGDSIDIEKGEVQMVKVKIRSPSNGKRGEILDLNIFVKSTGDSSVNDSVTTSIKILAEKDDGVPGFGLSLLVIALLIPIATAAFSRKSKKRKQN